jgi:hypothetical protein
VTGSASVPVTAKIVRADRVDGVDAARGLAIALMVLSHTVMGLLAFRLLPKYGLVPVHLLTKISSSLFILTFGVAVGLVYLPRVGTARWPEVRRKLWVRALVVLFWYKALTFVQMFERYGRDWMIDTLLWRKFPDFVEILEFYGAWLLVLPLLLPLLSRLSVWTQLLIAFAMAVTAELLRGRFDFFGIWQLEAIFIEHPDTFCFGLLTRGALVIAGIGLGSTLVEHSRERMVSLAQGLVLVGLAALALFYLLYEKRLDQVFVGIAKNSGKHPPAMAFMTFSVGGAALMLGLILAVPPLLAPLLWPLRVLGKESLFCFVTHILVIFVGYRYLLGLRRDVTYQEALGLVAINLLVCGLGAGAKRLVQSRLRRRKNEPIETAPDPPWTGGSWTPAPRDPRGPYPPPAVPPRPQFGRNIRR